MDLVGLELRDSRSRCPITVLHRPDGIWHASEIGRFVNGLTTSCVQHPKHPEYVLLAGEHTKADTLRALGGGQAYTATLIMGMDNPELPFTVSSFI